MSNSIKTILFSQAPLPFSKIGSWTTLYKNYLSGKHEIDFIVCPKPERPYENIKYSFVTPKLWHKFQSKFLKRRKTEYLEAFDKLVDTNEKYIIQLVDDYGMVRPLKNYLVAKGIHKQCYIQFFYHGYPPYSQNDFYENIDEIVLLTNDSYIAHKEQVNVMPSYFSILYNGIDTQRFSKVSSEKKLELKKQLGFNNEKIFIWCSQDKPKKGLYLILEAWQNIYSPQKNIKLLVIGVDFRQEKEGVVFLGIMDNDKLPEYYQISDCYLFPTLCQEGFGLSLIEALHCGNYCIASALGGIPEVLQYGKLGRLIENPHFISEWEIAINDFLEGKFEISGISDELYSTKSWNLGMNKIIENAKKRLE